MTKKDPEVAIFGEKINNSNAQGSTWGAFLIFAGILLLLNSLQVIPWDVWEGLIRFWPVLLILGGIHIILGENKGSRIIMTVLSLIIFGLVLVIVLLDTAPHLVSGLPPQVRDWADTFESYIEVK